MVMCEDCQGYRRDMVVIFAFCIMSQSEERRDSSVLHYDLEKVLICGLVKSHLEYHSQVGTSQLQKEDSR